VKALSLRLALSLNRWVIINVSGSDEKGENKNFSFGGGFFPLSL
jgi:hypothetical protein